MLWVISRKIGKWISFFLLFVPRRNVFTKIYQVFWICSNSTHNFDVSSSNFRRNYHNYLEKLSHEIRDDIQDYPFHAWKSKTKEITWNIQFSIYCCKSFRLACCVSCCCVLLELHVLRIIFFNFSPKIIRKHPSIAVTPRT